MRWMSSLLLVWAMWHSSAALAGGANGEPVLVPDFTPISVSEFGVAFELQDVVYGELRHHGFTVLTSQIVSDSVGPGFTSCADVPDCPRAALMNLPARLAVVVAVGRDDGVLFGRIHVHNQMSADPVVRIDLPIDRTRKERFGIEVALAVLDYQATLPPLAPELVTSGNQLVSSASTPAAGHDHGHGEGGVNENNVDSAFIEPIPTVVVPESRAVAVAVAPDPPQDRWSLDERFFQGSRRGYAKSPWAGDEWVRSTRSHGGRVIIEIRGGVVHGGVNRQAEILADKDGEGGLDFTWYQEAPDVGTGGVVGAYLGYAPLTWLDVGLAAYLEIAGNTARVGWMNAGESNTYGEISSNTSFSVRFQPRVRAWIVPLGVVKPYVFAGFDLWYFPPYDLDVAGGYTFPEPTGGVVPGADGGAGVQFDPGVGYGLFLEMSYIQRFGGRAGTTTVGRGTGLQDAPFRSPTWTISAVAGVQFRI